MEVEEFCKCFTDTTIFRLGSLNISYEDDSLEVLYERFEKEEFIDKFRGYHVQEAYPYSLRVLNVKVID